MTTSARWTAAATLLAVIGVIGVVVVVAASQAAEAAAGPLTPTLSPQAPTPTRTDRASGAPAGRGSDPPLRGQGEGYYHPRAPKLFETLDEFEAWERSAPPRPAPAAGPAAAHAAADSASRYTVGLTVSMTSYQQRNVAHVDALIAEVEARGHRAVTLVHRGAPDPTRFIRGDKAVVDVVIQVGSVFVLRDRKAFLEQLAALDVPVLSAFHHHSQNEAQYAASPTGLLPTLASAVVDAELDARFEPMPVSGRGAKREGERDSHGGDAYAVDPYRGAIAWRVDRALGWAKLRHTPNARKRLFFTYWSQGGGKANVGGDPDDFLDVPATIVRLMREMRARGYDVGPGEIPDRDTITRRMAREGSNVGNWAPGELASRVARGEVRLVPEDEYRAWFDALPRVRRDEIVAMWGPPPGKVGVHTDARGRRSLVVPGLIFGNVMFAPNPDWGYLQDAKALMSTGALPPHHQYLAFFLWMQKEWRADAWVSFFSNISLQGGKPVGPLPDEHIGILLGAVPHIHPERLGANGGLKSKRKALAQTTSWYSIVRPSGAAAQYGELRSLLQRYALQDDEELRKEAERLIRAEVDGSGLSRALEKRSVEMPIGDLVAAVQRELDRIDRMFVPSGSKVLGDAAKGDALVDMVTAMLGREFVDALPGGDAERRVLARALVRDVVIDGRAAEDAMKSRLGRAERDITPRLGAARQHAANLAAAPREVESLFEALDGRWIPPGSMDDPLRRPNALPPGRSVYNFDSALVPTIEAEALGIKQAEALIAAYRGKNEGAYPTSHAFAIFSGEIARNHGVSEAQILHLLGTRAVRDAQGVVTGVALIPRDQLGRPRVDVMLTTSGTYRDHYPDVMALVAKAAQLAATSPEDDNPVRKAVTATETALRSEGKAADDAARLARARVFAPAPGAYSPSIQFLAKSGDQRGDERKMAELYTSRLSHAYGEGVYGEASRPAFERQLARIEGASFARSSVVNGMLDNPMPAGFLGGLNLASKAVTGRDIDLYIDNLRDERNPTLESASSEIQRELRTRYFNKSWVAEMQTHGYEGARTFMYLTDHLDLWDSTATRTVGSDDWREVKRVYVDDSLGVGMDGFFDRYNPHAQQVLLGNLLGAASRGQWEASAADKAQIASRLARSVASHGIACEANMCRNPALTRLIETALEGTAEGAALIEGYTSALRAATTTEAPAETTAEVKTDTATGPMTGAAPVTDPGPPDGVTPNRIGRTAPGQGRASASAFPARGAAPRMPARSATPRPRAPEPSAPQAAVTSGATMVTGRVMETVAQSAAPSPRTHDRELTAWLLLASVSAACVVFGWLRQTREASHPS